MRVLAIDQGTSATKALVVDEAGRVEALAEVPLGVRHGTDGAVAVDSEELWTSVLAAGTSASCRTAPSRSGPVWEGRVDPAGGSVLVTVADLR